MDGEGSLTMYTDENNRVISTVLEMLPIWGATGTSRE
eukprot:gene38106-47023_t